MRGDVCWWEVRVPERKLKPKEALETKPAVLMSRVPVASTLFRIPADMDSESPCLSDAGEDGGFTRKE